MREKGYEEIYLESRGHALAITPAAYEQIRAIIEANLICVYCHEGYMLENPQVAENICLQCFLARRTTPPTDLTFVGEVPSEYATRYGYKLYQFVDADGYLYVASNTQKLNDTIEKDIRATLVHYGFRLPDKYMLKTRQIVELNETSWRRIYGDFRTSPVVLATYYEYYGNHLDTAYILYRDREPLELSKRRNPTRVWYLESKAAIEATFSPREGYVVGRDADGQEQTAYQLYDYHLYPGIVERARQAYEEQE